VGQWDLSIVIILVLNFASQYCGVHPMNTQYTFICCTQFTRFYTVYSEQPVLQVTCVSCFFIQVHLNMSYLCLKEPINYSFLWNLQFLTE